MGVDISALSGCGDGGLGGATLVGGGATRPSAAPGRALAAFTRLPIGTRVRLIEDKAAVVAACGDALIWEDSMMSRMLGGEFVVADVDARDRTYHLCRPEHLEIAKSMHEFWWPFVACVVLDPVPGEAEA